MISVIIANHNGASVIERCLSSLGEPDDRLEVLLVDNASTDGSLDLVKSRFPWVRTLPQTENLGFAAANNLAAEHARGDALLMLNADAWLGDGALGRLRNRLDTHPRTALVAPSLRYPSGRPQFVWSPARGVVGEAMQMVRNRFEDRALAHGAFARVLARIAGRIWYTAACVLVRASAFAEVGGFDTRFFMYFEDVDLCLRFEAAGWRLDQEPAAVVHHQGGFARSADVDEIYRPSQLRFYRLHRPGWEARFIERRLRRRYGSGAVDRWLSEDGR